MTDQFHTIDIHDNKGRKIGAVRIIAPDEVVRRWVKCGRNAREMKRLKEDVMGVKINCDCC